MLSNNFEDLVWLFQSDNKNRNIIRQNFNEAAFLWKMVRMTSGPILEIGRKYGGSTVLLLSAGSGRHVTSIDLYPKHNPLCENIFKNLENNNLYLITGDSRKELKNQQFGFMFVDGDHSYDGVKADIYTHWKNLKTFNNNDPIVVFHDAVPNDGLKYKHEINHADGVLKLCNSLVSNKCASIIGSAGSSLALKKTNELPSNL